MLLLIYPKHSQLKWVWPENENTVSLKSASLVVIMLLQEGLTHIHLQKKKKKKKKSLSSILARISLLMKIQLLP